jgi:hypothetical protein
LSDEIHHLTKELNKRGLLDRVKNPCKRSLRDILAEAMINSRPLGAMVPMSDEAIAELNEAFKL